MSQRIVITAGTAQYDDQDQNALLQRPVLTEVVADVTQLFTHDFGYAQVFPEFNQRAPTSDELRKALDRWLGSNERDPNDWVVFYYTGHGELDASNALYLLTRDFEPGLHSSTAFPLGQLGSMLIGQRSSGGPRRVRRFLLILDTCYSGAGVPELYDKFTSMFAQGIADSMFYILAAAFPNGEAMAGALAKALIESLRELSSRGTQNEFIYFDQLIPAINKKLRAQQVVYASVTSQAEEPKFFPNPNYIPHLPADVTVAEIRRVTELGELQTFWDPISRGVEVEQQAGWYFTGREKVLRELSAWLDDPQDTSTKVVTGQAGTGKSAILARLVTLSEPSFRVKMPLAERDRSVGGGAHGLDLAIHAKGKTLDEIIARFAVRLQVDPTRAAVLEALQAQPTPFRVVVDALDEAREPIRIAREFLQPLTAYPTVKLLVGTRPEYATEVGTDATLLNIDQPEYLDHGDLIDYVKIRLLCREDPKTQTPYRDQDVLARQVAMVVANKAYPNFLIARLIAESLLALPEAKDATEVKQIGLPGTVDAAFGQYLARFGEDEENVRRVLTALAWTEGRGLPWDHHWAPVASALSGHPCDDEDIARVVRLAGAFVVEALEQERSVYRLYHQALADYFRQGHDVAATQGLIVQALVGSVPFLPDAPGRDWRVASPYIRFHLAEHAAASGQLEALVNDPLYLLCADPGRLLSVLATHASVVSRDAFHLYQSIVHQIREKPLHTAASYLQMSAQKRGLTAFANHPSLYHMPQQWEVKWARWQREAPGYALLKCDAPMSRFTTAIWASRPIVVLGLSNGSVDVRDGIDGARLAFCIPQTGVNIGYVNHMKIAEHGHKAWLVVSWSNNWLGVFELSNGEQVMLSACDSDVLALATATRREEPVCVTAHSDLSIKIWAVPTLELVVERPKATAANLYGLFDVTIGQRAMILSTGDHLNYETDTNAYGTLRLWSLNDLSLVWEEAPREAGIFKHAESGVFFNRLLTVVSQDTWGAAAEIWDLERGYLVFRDAVYSDRSWLYQHGDETFLFSQDGETLRVQRMITQETAGKLTMTADQISDRALVKGKTFSGIVYLRGRAVWLNTVDEHVHVWDVEELLAEAQESHAQTDSHLSEIRSLTAGSSAGRILYAGGIGEVITLDAATGTVQAASALPEAYLVGALVLLEKQGTLVAGTSNGFLYALDINCPDAPPRLLSQEQGIEAVNAVTWQGRPLVAATVKRRDAWAVRIWDLETGEQVPTKGAYALGAGENDKIMRGLAVTEIEGKIKLAFASKYGQIMVGEFDGGLPQRRHAGLSPAYEVWEIIHPEDESHSKPFRRTDEYTRCLAQGAYFGKPLLASATEYGLLTIWDFRTGADKARISGAHRGQVLVLCFHEIHGRLVVVSGGEDGLVKFWTTELQPLFSIEIGSPIYSLTWTSMDHLAVGAGLGVLMFCIHDLYSLRLS